MTVFEKHGHIDIDIFGVRVVALPYAATSHAYDPALAVREHASERGDRRVVVLGHLSVPGVQPGEETTEMPRGREVVFPLEECRGTGWVLANGHYHRRQVTPEGVHIPGSLARFTFGEQANEPGYMILDVDVGQCAAGDVRRRVENQHSTPSGEADAKFGGVVREPHVEPRKEAEHGKAKGRGKAK